MVRKVVVSRVSRWARAFYARRNISLNRFLIFDGNILTLDETDFHKAALERAYKRCGFARCRVVDQGDSQDALLCARRERPRRRAAKERDERAPFQLIEPHLQPLDLD
jgi:hypothetical protein